MRWIHRRHFMTSVNPFMCVHVSGEGGFHLHCSITCDSWLILSICLHHSYRRPAALTTTLPTVLISDPSTTATESLGHTESKQKHTSHRGNHFIKHFLPLMSLSYTCRLYCCRCCRCCRYLHCCVIEPDIVADIDHTACDLSTENQRDVR